MKKKRRQSDGVIALEACLCLTLFMFLILFLYSFFAIFEAQSKIHHTLLQTSQSMSLDSFATERLKENTASLFDVVAEIGFNASNKNPKYVSTDAWYKNKEKVADIAKERFVAYLTAGDQNQANQLLVRYKIKDGLSGLDFSASTINENGDIELKVKYTIQFLFDYKAFNLSSLQVTDSVTSRKWE